MITSNAGKYRIIQLSRPLQTEDKIFKLHHTISNVRLQRIFNHSSNFRGGYNYLSIIIIFAHWMKVSLNWLKTLIHIDKTPAEIEEILTATGLEVEHYETVESVKGGLNGLVIGEVMICEKHPNADKLSLTKVNIGTGQLLSIVCGAPNVAAGLKVIVAPVGTTVYPTKGEPFTIQKAKIRGESSEGMLCSEDEIGLGESHAGLLILPPDAGIGKKVSEYFKVSSDVVFEIGLTANRGDAASHIGVARELATVLNLPFKLREYPLKIEKGKATLQVEILDPEACPRYTGLVLDKVKVAESPEWLKQFLQAIGVKPINNVVDISNFVLHELGQPMHAFDYSEIKGEKIIVRRAEKGTDFTTLDGEKHSMLGNELVICDTSSPMCLAGIYGGKDSGVADSTTRIFLESAYFSPDVTRKTAKQHGLNTDSSFRFERGTDPEMCIPALKRAADLMHELCGAVVVSDIYDIYPEPLKPFEVTLRIASIEKVSGIEIPEGEVERILTGLGITLRSKSAEAWELSVPRFKSDVTREIDVIEELIRIYGFKHIPLKQHMEMALNYKAKSPLRSAEKKISHLLMGMGFSEIMCNSLSSDKFYTETDSLVRLSNPLSAEMNVMRQSMLYPALEAIAYNKNRKQSNTHFFEFGRVYSQKEKGFSEKEQLLIIVSGKRTHESWEEKQRPADHYFLKSAGTRIADAFKANSDMVQVEQVDPKTLQTFGIKDDVYYTVIDWTKMARQQRAFELQPIPQFPVVRRDLSLVLDKQVSFQQVSDIVSQSGSDKIIGTNVFDVYEGKPLDEGKKSISIFMTARKP
jgi:phenylalanyl-tRNA synthetase beta chain